MKDETIPKYTGTCSCSSIYPPDTILPSQNKRDISYIISTMLTLFDFSTDQFHFPLQHRTNPDDQTASLYDIRDNPVQVNWTLPAVKTLPHCSVFFFNTTCFCFYLLQKMCSLASLPTTLASFRDTLGSWKFEDLICRFSIQEIFFHVLLDHLCLFPLLSFIC